MEDEGLVVSGWQEAASRRRRRCYYLTDEGRQLLGARLKEWGRFSVAAERVMASD